MSNYLGTAGQFLLDVNARQSQTSSAVEAADQVVELRRLLELRPVTALAEEVQVALRQQRQQLKADVDRDDLVVTAVNQHHRTGDLRQGLLLDGVRGAGEGGQVRAAHRPAQPDPAGCG